MNSWNLCDTFFIFAQIFFDLSKKKRIFAPQSHIAAVKSNIVICN